MIITFLYFEGTALSEIIQLLAIFQSGNNEVIFYGANCTCNFVYEQNRQNIQQREIERVSLNLVCDETN